MTDDQLAKLAVAREKALVVRRAQKVEKLKAEAARLEAPSQTEEVQPSGDDAAPVDATPAAPPPSTAGPVEQQTPEQVEPAPKAKAKKKNVIRPHKCWVAPFMMILRSSSVFLDDTSVR